MATNEKLARKIDRAVRSGKIRQAWKLLDGQWDRVLDSRLLAGSWLSLLESDGQAQADRGALEAALVRWEDDPHLVFHLCHQLLDLVDGRPMDDPVPEDDPALLVIPYLQGAIEALDPRARQDPDEGGFYWNTLGNAYRLAGPDHDGAALDAYSQALATRNRPAWRFNMGLLFKNRRRWEEGTRIFEELFAEDQQDQSILWNLGICATAHGAAEVACQAWLAAGFPAKIGADGRPSVEPLGQVKVRIPGYPEDAPEVVCFEHVWVQPLSPCHGRVLNPMLYFSQVEAHDLVLWDGQPIGYVQADGGRIPRFAMLDQLAGGGWRSFRFRAEQAESGQVSGVTNSLPHESSLYVFDEQVVFLCQECVRTGGPHTDEHDRGSEDSAQVSGKILVCPKTSLPALRDTLEEAVARVRGLVFSAPELYEELGDNEGAEEHRKKWAEL